MAAFASQVIFNKLFQLAVVSHKGSMPDIHRKNSKVMGKILVEGKYLTLGGKGTRKEALLGGRQDRVVPRVRLMSSSH